MRYLPEAILNPYFIALLLLIIALVCAYHKPQKSGIVKGSLTLALLILLIFFTGWFPEYLTGILERSYRPVQSIQKDISFVVVLSGGQSNDPGLPANMQLYGSSQQRLWEGLRLLKQLPEARLILSGGSYNLSEPTEASNLAVLAQLCLQSRARVILEARSLNTAQQALYLKNIVGKKPFYVVTSAIHMPRAISVMNAAGLNAIPAPTDFTRFWSDERWTKKWIPNPYNLVYSTILVHELLGRLYYSLERRYF